MDFLQPEDALLSSRQRRKTALTVLALSDGTIATVDSYAKPAFDDIINAAKPPTPSSMWLFNVSSDWLVAQAVLRLQFPDLRVHIVFDLVHDRAFLRQVLEEGTLTLTTLRRPDRPLSLAIDTGGLADALAAVERDVVSTEQQLVATGYREGTLTVDGCGPGTTQVSFARAGTHFAEVDVEGSYIRVTRWPGDDGDEVVECVTIDLAPHRFRNLAARILRRDNLRVVLKPLGVTIECSVGVDEMAGDLRCSVSETVEELAESALPIAAVQGRTVVLDAADRPAIVEAIAGGTPVEWGFTYGWTEYIEGRYEPFAYFIFDFAGGERLAVHLDAPSQRAALTEIARTGTLVLATTANPNITRSFPVDVEFVGHYLGSAGTLAARTS